MPIQRGAQDQQHQLFNVHHYPYVYSTTALSDNLKLVQQSGTQYTSGLLQAKRTILNLDLVKITGVAYGVCVRIAKNNWSYMPYYDWIME